MLRRKASYRDRMNVQRCDDAARELNRINHDIRMYKECLNRMPEQEAFIKGEIDRLNSVLKMMKGGE